MNAICRTGHRGIHRGGRFSFFPVSKLCHRAGGVEKDAEGNTHLKARVSAVPEGGKANKALIVFLAKKLGLPKSSISFVSGETARKKILRIDTDPEDFEELFKKL